MITQWVLNTCINPSQLVNGNQRGWVCGWQTKQLELHLVSHTFWWFGCQRFPTGSHVCPLGSLLMGYLCLTSLQNLYMTEPYWMKWALGAGLALSCLSSPCLLFTPLLSDWEGLLLLRCFSLWPASQKKPFLPQTASCPVPWKEMNVMHSFLPCWCSEIPLTRHGAGQIHFLSWFQRDFSHHGGKGVAVICLGGLKYQGGSGKNRIGTKGQLRLQRCTLKTE